ncbi:MAG: hypothetical protein PQJ59_12350 [Spirochaetales bacterium]|nr:hypothetical protein [Spirochaetales bacterium]
MKRNKARFIGKGILYGIGALAFAAVFAFLFGWVLMLLWNWLMPEIFGLATISYIQAWGLILLSHLLFKGGGHGGRHSDHFHGTRSRDGHFHGPHGRHLNKEDVDFFKREFRKRMNRHWDEESCCEADYSTTEEEGTENDS